MYVVTNRVLHENATGLDVFGKTPNAQGPNELRMVDVRKTSRGYSVEPVDDKLSKAEVKELRSRHGLTLDTRRTWHGSLRVACDLFSRARKQGRHILFYVHGYNNDMKDVLDGARALERLYKTIVVPFSWPANGGGAISGTVAYLDDKQDARTSSSALGRFVGKVHEYHGMLTQGRTEELRDKAREKHKNNPEAGNAYFTELMENDCDVTLNLLCHSMGNYVMKYAVYPSGSGARKLTFDNVALVAADTNNEDHARWVENIQARRRIYVAINENDHALRWSRFKPGDEQLARLGHYLKNLWAENAHYLNVTNAKGVGTSHGYYKGSPVSANTKLRSMFRDIFHGGSVEERMIYRPDINVYELKA